jgi:hypothetical protein
MDLHVSAHQTSILEVSTCISYSICFLWLNRTVQPITIPHNCFVRIEELAHIINFLCLAGIKALTAMVMKRCIFWDIGLTPRSLVKGNRRFGGTCYLHLQGRRISSTCCLIHAGFLLGLILDPEDGSHILPRNFGRLSPDYTALCSRRWSSSVFIHINAEKSK